MKIAICSDLHLEFAPITLENPEKADVLILSGDICVGRDLMERDDPHPTNKSRNIHDFFYNCCNVFPHVVYVAGNHEHYHGDFAHTLKEIKRKLKYLPNLQVLDKECWDLYDEYRFIGGTLWTDMNNEDPLTLYHIKSRMNDFRCVENSNRMVTFKTYQPIPKPHDMTDEEYLALPHEKRYKTVFKEREAAFSPEDAVEDHRKMVNYLKFMYTETPEHMKIIVVGHHAPSKASTHPRYRNETLMNGAYSSELSDYILDHPRIKLWTHGHTHEDFDYMIGSTRVVCNPRGYLGYESRADRFQLKIVEV